jgi:hypothetical protein
MMTSELTMAKILPTGSQVAVQKIRSLPIDLWPAADRAQWIAACQSSVRLKRGGRAGHFKPVTQRDLARRYGYFLDFLNRHGLLDLGAAAGSQVIPANIELFLSELKARVSSATLYGTTYKVRRLAQLIAPGLDLRWLREIENDLAFVLEPRSKADRLILSQVLVEAGLTLIAEADANPKMGKFRRAVLFRDGMMIAILARHPIRNKNFATLKIGKTFRRVNNEWWLILDYTDTKEGRDDERRVDPMFYSTIERYLTVHRSVLGRGDEAETALWLSANDGKQMTENGVAKAISTATLKTVGVNLGPHMFRTSGSSTAAIYGRENPHLGSAIHNHRGVTVNQRHYNWANANSAAKALAEVIAGYKI